MHCPYCHAPAFESQPQCPACGFSLDGVETLFGMMPVMQPGITDQADILDARDARRRIDAAIASLKAAFPQIGLSVVTVRLQPHQPLSAYAFWVFNRSGICRELDKGGKSRDVLLTVDAANGRASLMIGYGLEPFVSEQTLSRILAVGAPAFSQGDWTSGIEAIIGNAEKTLLEILGALPRIYGLEPASLQSEEPAARLTESSGVASW